MVHYSDEQDQALAILSVCVACVPAWYMRERIDNLRDDQVGCSRSMIGSQAVL